MILNRSDNEFLDLLQSRREPKDVVGVAFILWETSLSRSARAMYVNVATYYCYLVSSCIHIGDLELIILPQLEFFSNSISSILQPARLWSCVAGLGPSERATEGDNLNGTSQSTLDVTVLFCGRGVGHCC
jgi:hypothetical protein